MPLDSDVQNADEHLFVQFYEHEREPYKGFDFVRIMNPGDKTNVYDQPATEAHKMRFPRHWLAYQAAKNGGAGSALGVTLGEWVNERPDDVTDGQVAELTMLGFQTVEQLAGASDHQIQRVGMGGMGLRERARNFLSARNAPAAVQALAAAQGEIAALKAQMAEMMAMMQQNAQPRTRRKADDDGQHDAGPGPAGHG